MAIDITLQIPTLTAENILRELRETTRALMTEHKFTYGWSHVFIPRTGGTIFVQIDIDDRNMDITYLVGCNPDFEAEYPKLTYNQALRELRGLLQYEVIF